MQLSTSAGASTHILVCEFWYHSRDTEDYIDVRFFMVLVFEFVYGMVDIVCAGVKGQAIAGVCYVYTWTVSAAGEHQEAVWQVRVAAGSAGFL